ncbi:unnamed protein product [Sphagnum jensenii]|uniref:RING-type E3 ubiquitin transferase n=1 Tax=Sphagnum jensenii TaxID=128206 RepID=A0ABP0WTA1_9BRYO
MTSAAAFVEGGVQDACDDACSICLESFCDEDPATVTNCRHEYHLQCILEWSQRSKECPMCWQALSLKDPDSQDLLAAVADERALRRNKVRVSSIHQRSSVEESEFHQVILLFSSYGDEECLMQHLAAAAIGRTHHFSRRGPILFQPAAQASGHLQHVLVSSSSGSGGSTPVSSPPVASSPPSHEAPPPSFSFTTIPAVGADHSALGSSSPRSACIPLDVWIVSKQVSALEPDENQHATSSSELHSFSETMKSRLAVASSRCKESLSKTTRGFRERLRMRSGTMADIGARAREVSAGVVRVLERISLEPLEKQQVSASSSDVPLVPSNSSEPTLPCSASGVTVYAGSVNASSSRVAPQPANDNSHGDGLEKGCGGTGENGREEAVTPL